jgi:hypothetical protein
MLPLVDDDTIEVTSGEFEVVAVEGAYKDRLADLGVIQASFSQLQGESCKVSGEVE